MKTEAEARKCVCPMTFSPFIPGGSESHPGSGSSWGAQMPGFKQNCIASECMVWRWHGQLPIEAAPDAPSRMEKHGQPIGFCGLAGKP